MSIRNRILIALVVLMAALSIGHGFAQPTAKKDSPREVPEKDYLQEMIELVVEANPTLQSQRNLIKEIETISQPVKGPDLALSLKTGAAVEGADSGWERRVAPTGGLELSIPLYSSAKKRKVALDKLTVQKDLAKVWQDYYHLKNSVISDLLTKVDKLSSLKNELDGQKKLLSLLQHNLEAFSKQVEAGVARPSDLWAISERIMIIEETKIQNLSSQLATLKREVAVNLAGARWLELLEMLNQIGRQTQPQE